MGHLYELPNATTGIDDIAVQVVTAVPGYTPMLLMFIFLVVFMGGVGRQKARSGTADYPMWAVLASISTFFSTLLLSMISGLIALEILVIVVVITIFSAVWLFLDRKQSEV